MSKKQALKWIYIMKENTDLLNFTHALCQAIESSGTICFKTRYRRSKFCSMHLTRLGRFDSFDLPKKIDKKCKFIDCNLISGRTGYCKKHYKTSNICKMQFCNKRVTGYGLCVKHYSRLKRHGDATIVLSPYKGSFKNSKRNSRRLETNKTCLVTDCEKTHLEGRIIKGLCTKHYYRWKRFGDYNIKSKKDFNKKLTQ